MRAQSLAAASAGAGVVQLGSAPYTPAQVQAGKVAYTASCTAYHGAQLQGISAPALAGSAFGKSRLSISALRTIVTKEMPLTAPGSLTPAQYASLMAFLLAANCIKPSANGTTPFPVSDQPSFKSVILAGGACTPTLGAKRPSNNPAAIASRIQAGRKRSSKESPEMTFCSCAARDVRFTLRPLRP